MFLVAALLEVVVTLIFDFRFSICVLVTTQIGVLRDPTLLLILNSPGLSVIF